MPGINPTTIVEGEVQRAPSGPFADVPGDVVYVDGLQDALDRFVGKRVVIYIEEAAE
jgi:hypothetical protein